MKDKETIKKLRECAKGLLDVARELQSSERVNPPRTLEIVERHIKANIPGRIAFMTACCKDSKLLIDDNGAEKLLGDGDSLLRGGHSGWSKMRECGVKRVAQGGLLVVMLL